MIVMVNGRKTAVATTIGLCFIGRKRKTVRVWTRERKRESENWKEN